MGAVASGVGGVFGDVFSGVKRAFGVPSPPEAPRGPSAETPAIQQAISEAARRRSRARGARSTILSSNFLSPENPALQTTFGS